VTRRAHLIGERADPLGQALSVMEQDNLGHEYSLRSW